MKVLHLLRNPFYGLLSVLFLLLHAYPASAGQAACDDVASNGRLNILTINLLFSEIATRDARLASIAEFVAVNRVDVLLLQEVVGGELVSTDNSARDLQEILANPMHRDRSARVLSQPLRIGLFTQAVLAVLSIAAVLIPRAAIACNIFFTSGQALISPPGMMDGP